MLQGPGENAGVVDVGDGLAVAFKVESHNHPSAVEPFQGAATGVGGILRDIVAMGARPIALLDWLRFGGLDDEHRGWMFARAVAGIGGYGNCVGVPTVGGEVVFDERYDRNCLVNAMCVGLLPADRVTRAQMSGPGNLVVLFGATTGRDGIGGASVLASQELSDEDEDKRPTVQIGDPFTGKKLIEASLELVEGGLVESLQDCGAAGLASSLSEMASKGGAGVDVHLDRVPLREAGMEPWEIMISESQERMVGVCAPSGSRTSRPSAGSGSSTSPSSARVTDSGQPPLLRSATQLVGDIPARLLTDECPRYRVETRPRAARRADAAHSPTRRRTTCSSCSPRRTSPAARGSTSQYDQLVGSRTVRRPGLDAAVLRLRPVVPGPRGVARRGRPARVARPSRRGDARRPRGGPQRRLRRQAARSPSPTASTSATPRSRRSPGSSPRRSRACRSPARRSAFPVVSGNVSLYNETDGTRHPPDAGRRLRRARGRRASASARVARRATRCCSRARPSCASTAPSTRRSSSAAAAGRPPCRTLPAEAALIAFLWRAAPPRQLRPRRRRGRPRGGARRVRRGVRHSAQTLEVSSHDAVERYGEGGGQAVVASAAATAARSRRWPRRPACRSDSMGEVGGDTLLDIPLDALRERVRGRSSREARIASDVRDLRHLRARARRRAITHFGLARAPASGAGVGRESQSPTTTS